MTDREKMLAFIEDKTDEEVIILENYDYASAFVGITDDNRAIYDYDKMIDYLIKEDGFTAEEAVEWIDYNTIRALPYMGELCPIIMYHM